MTKPAFHAKGEVGVFLALLLLLSGLFYAVLFLQPGVRQRWGGYSVEFMWCPGIAALVTQVLMRRSVRELGWGWGGLRYYLLAYTLPIGFCLAAYVPVWLGLHAFRPEALTEARMKLRLPVGVIGNLGMAFLFALTQPFLGMIGSLGEEIGWRGFLVARLYPLMGFTKTSFTTGLIWAIWHYPVVAAVFPLYRPHVPLPYALTCFTVAVVAISFVHSWLRLQSGSVWPSALFHSAGNAFVVSFQALTRENTTTSYLTFEYGLGLALVLPPLAYVFWKRWQRRSEAYAASV